MYIVVALSRQEEGNMTETETPYISIAKLKEVKINRKSENSINANWLIHNWTSFLVYAHTHPYTKDVYMVQVFFSSFPSQT